MAGFAVGVADRKRIITGERIGEGDVLIGLPSSGVHSNGYSLVRKVFFEKMGMKVSDYVEELGTTLGEALLKPTRIYAGECGALMENADVKGIVHITGGGFYENIPRILPEGTAVSIDTGSWEEPEIFRCIAEMGGIERREMFSTYNMGIGMIAAVAEKDAEKAVEAVKKTGEEAFIIGRTVKDAGEKVLLDI